MGESHSKGADSSAQQTEGLETVKTAEVIAENTEGDLPNRILATEHKDPEAPADSVKNHQDHGDITHELTANEAGSDDLKDTMVAEGQTKTKDKGHQTKTKDKGHQTKIKDKGHQTKIKDEGREVVSHAKPVDKDEVKDKETKAIYNEKSAVCNEDNEKRSNVSDAEVSLHSSEITDPKDSAGNRKSKMHSEKQQKRSSKKWSLRKHSSKSKASKETVIRKDRVTDDDIKTDDQQLKNEVIEQDVFRENSGEQETFSESTQDRKESEKKAGRKSVKKSKSPSIFRRRSKSKNVDRVSSSTGVISENKQTRDGNLNDDNQQAIGTGNGLKTDQLDSGKPTEALVDDVQRNRSKSLEIRDKKIHIYVRDDNEGVVDTKRATSMKNLKTSKDVGDAEVKGKQMADCDDRGGKGTVNSHSQQKQLMQDRDEGAVTTDKTRPEFVNVNTGNKAVTAPRKPPRTNAEFEQNKTAKSVTTAESSANIIHPVDVSSVATRTKSAPSKPSIIITPAYEAEAHSSVDKSQVRQTAVVTVTREIITSTTSPPEPIAKHDVNADSPKSPIIQLPTVKTYRISNIKQKTSESKQEDAGATKQKESFSIVEVKSPLSKEHKLLQITMQTICQKANQLQKLMSSTQTVQASLMAYHRLQLLAIADKEKEINVATGRIAQTLKEEVDEKLGVGQQRVASCLAECKLHLTTFQAIIESGNRLLQYGSVSDVILKEGELASQLKVLDKHLQALQAEPISADLDSGKFVFVPGTTDNLELKAMFGELILDRESDAGDHSTGGQLARRPAPQLCWSENPWIPYFRRNADTRLTGNELMNARIRQELCYRDLTRILNLVSGRHLTGFVLELLECGIDTEMKMKKLCELVVSLAAGCHHMAATLATLCRCVSSLSVPNDSHQESRQARRSTVLNFLDRFCMRRYQLGADAFLATGTTPAVSRTSSFLALPRDGSRRSSMSGRHALGRSPRARPPPTGGPQSQVVGPAGDVERRYNNLSLLNFVCEMFKLKLATEAALHEWLNRLGRVDGEEAAEALCFVMFRIGRFLDHRRAEHLIDKLFVQLTYTAARHATSGRLRAMINDVIELRDNDWVPTRSPNYWRFLIG